MRDRLLGILLFLPVPVVLFLFTRAPLGVPASLALGAILVLTHRLYARPFALSRAARRCLWCGGALTDGTEIKILEPSGPSLWRACPSGHERRLLVLLAFSSRHRVWVKAGIATTLALFFALSLARVLGWGAIDSSDPPTLLRLGVALSILPLAFLGGRQGVKEEGPPRVPFPVHLQSLLGTVSVLWLFRIVGTAWLLLGAASLAQRLLALGAM